MTVKFKLPDSFIEPYKTRKVNWGYGALSETVFLRSYSQLKEDGTKERWWECCRRVIEATFQIQKEHCKANKLPWNQAKAQRTAQDAFERMFVFKWTPPGRGMARMGTPIVERLGAMALMNCLQGDTKVLTSEGYRSIKDLDGTTQTVMTGSGGWIDAPFYSYGEQPLWRITLGRASQRKEIYATENHNWYVHSVTTSGGSKVVGTRHKVTTKELTDKHRVATVYGQGVLGNIHLSAQGVAHGFTFGDGNTRRNDRASGNVYLFGEKDADVLPYFPGRKREHDVSVGGWVALDLPNYFRKLPPITENKSYLYGWLAGYFAADGTVSKKGDVEISSTNISHLEFVQDVCGVIGIGTHDIRKEDRISNLTNSNSTLYKLTLMLEKLPLDFFVLSKHRDRAAHRMQKEGFGKRADKEWRVISVEPTDRVETVYCAEVPTEEHAFVLENNILTGNCAALTTEEFVGAMEYLMDASMLGVGVGYDTAAAGKYTIQNPTKVGTYVVPDSREGWVESTRMILMGYMHGDNIPEMDYSEIRPNGAPISSGGTAPGPDPLIILHERLYQIYSDREGDTLTIADVVDTGNVIGACVVAGGNRRTALIAVTDGVNEEFISLKDYGKNPYREGWGWASNNSVRLKVGESISDAALKNIAINGEPGVIYPELMEDYGRLIDPPNYKDKGATVPNPCGEIGLTSIFNKQAHKAGGENCNLSDINMTKHDSLEDYLQTIKLAFLYNKTVTLLPTHNEMANAIILKNRRIGASLGGVTDFIDEFGIVAFREWADKGYNSIVRWDETYSAWLCVRESIKLTSIKPSGSTSTLVGVSPGVHFNVGGKFYIRRVNYTKGDPVLQALKDAGYPYEQSAYVDNFEVIEFPIKTDARRADNEVPAYEKMMIAAEAQALWADNAVSCTVSFSKEEAKEIGNLLALFEGKIKGISFLPLVEGGAYKQMPYETISEEEYEKRASAIKEVDLSPLYDGNFGKEAEVEVFCTTDSCEAPALPPLDGEPTRENAEYDIAIASLTKSVNNLITI